MGRRPDPRPKSGGQDRALPGSCRADVGERAYSKRTPDCVEPLVGHLRPIAAALGATGSLARQHDQRVSLLILAAHEQVCGALKLLGVSHDVDLRRDVLVDHWRKATVSAVGLGWREGWDAPEATLAYERSVEAAKVLADYDEEIR